MEGSGQHRDESATAQWDPLGSVLVVVGIAVLSYAIVQSGDQGWLDARTIGLLAFGFAVLGGFVARCAHHPAPVVDLHLFDRPTFRVTVVIGFAISFGVCAVFPKLGFTEYVGDPVLSPLVSILTAVALGVVGLIAGYFPAREASRLDPVIAMKL